MLATRLAQRAAAAFFAMAFRFLAERALARAAPPLAAPSRDRAWACGFFPSAGFRTAPVASSTTRRAFWAKSARLPPLLARVGMTGVCHSEQEGTSHVELACSVRDRIPARNPRSI